MEEMHMTVIDKVHYYKVDDVIKHFSKMLYHNAELEQENKKYKAAFNKLFEACEKISEPEKHGMDKVIWNDIATQALESNEVKEVRKL